LTMATTPTLDRLADDPGKAAALPLEATTALLARLAVAQAALTARAVALALAPPPPGAGDSLLDVPTTAAKLGVSTSYLYRHAKSLPFTVRVGRGVRFSAAGIDRYIGQQEAKPPRG